MYSITLNGGYSEIFQYIKEFLIVILLLMLAFDRKQPIYLAWSLLFLYILIDDSMQLHENISAYLAQTFDFKPMFRLKAVDFGELAVSAFFGGILFTLVGLAYWLTNAVVKQITKGLLLLVLSLAFFLVVVDMIHSMTPRGKSLFALIEDGGEMLIMSAIVYYIYLQHCLAATKPK